ncbi:hypothetical protein ASPSYDRAFT_81741 [Aspergillus sydowii CBS 593.65]|uniref:Carrier domain-containing protein n=1 Tax=Aspergillus sydowii CBS 593.65 TaxID=1036612 RepID=A0A1L9T666_9EURO|nr:uncharacterized protein ASPSYDRAFT_81741 [Aspergillus sydowii CBS 593.65]OJJ54865.1 hypothetical protein ASPSYDRAFT_81741 [Aspergillus sydowii CBS 593.65]
MAIEQMFITLCNGGTVVIAPSSIRGDTLELARLIMDERITYTMAVPSDDWRYAFSGGEKVTDRLRNEFQSLGLPQLQLINIKLRGQRVELDEIAHAVLQVSKGKAANVQVCVRGAGTDTFLVAFVVFSNGRLDEGIDRITYLKQLRRRIPLPRYMWPSIMVPLEELPLGVNGKVDRKALDAIVLPDPPRDDQALVALDEDETTLLRMWQEVLPDTAPNGLKITKDTDFFEAGGNSLSLVRRQSVIKDQLEAKIPLVELVESCSLEAMARRLWSNHSVSSSPSSWEDEASVLEPDQDLEYANLEVESSRITGNRGKIAILTGASGFLGKHVLQGLVASSAVSEVHCIAVRSQTSKEKLISIGSPKIVVHTGDLTRPHLGLDIPTARSLASRANVIVHNGADVSFLKSYSSLQKTNIGSTAELVRLAKPRRIPIHFISSAGVAGFVPRNQLPLREVSIAAYPPPRDSRAHGYQISKWVSEHLLETASQKYDLDIVLHRPTGIVGDEAPNADILGNLLRYSSQLNPGPFPVHELAKYLGQSQGAPLDTLPMTEWIALAMQAGINKMVGMYLQEVSSKRMGWYPPVVPGPVN